MASALASVAIPTPSFDQCWMAAIGGGLQWSSLIGCFLIFYCFAFSKTEMLWRVLFAHALSGFLGTLMETAFIAAKRDCVPLAAPAPTPPTSLAYILLLNEINWIVHESTTVWYSYIKTSVIFTSESLRKVFTILMIVLFIAFSTLRVNIGRLRFSENTLNNADIAAAHSYAFLVWGFADLIILFLLVWNVWDHVKRRANAESKGMIMTLMNSSIPRIAIIFFNTFAIVAIGQLKPPTPTIINNFNSFLWLVKGSYPMILLLDILMTKSLLISSRDKSSTHKRNPSSRTGAGAWGNDSTEASSGGESYQLRSVNATQQGSGMGAVEKKTQVQPAQAGGGSAWGKEKDAGW
ncbi:hypothetical protein HDU67_001055, partial [Dinochytrium kinnereticum]